MSFAGDAAARPPRITLHNIGSGETVEMPFFPSSLTEGIIVSYARQKIVGMSHTTLQYGNTENYTLPGLDFFFRATTPEELDANLEARKFLMSLCYSREGSQGVRGGGPPRILFIWPQLISLTTKITNLRITHTKFNVRGAPTVSSAKFDLEEIRDARLTSEEVRTFGTIRDPGGQGQAFTLEEIAELEGG